MRTLGPRLATILFSLIAAVSASEKPSPLLALNAPTGNGVEEITRQELERRMGRSRPLSDNEKAALDRGCLGLVCLYQGLDQKRWPESAPGTKAYLTLEDALKRVCRGGRENFVFLKQAWWSFGKPPRPIEDTREVSLESVTRLKPGKYTFNYAVYFPSTATYVWINHRDYGFPLNFIKPQRVYLSHSPPPLEEFRPAQIYCSTCR